MSSPLVSVIVPAYNAEKYILETIESVQDQTYSNWEMIIVDDGSTDNTAHIIQQECKKDLRIQYHYQHNGKQGKARNLAIRHAIGEYLAFIDADDLWHPQKLEKQVKLFEERPNIDLIFTNGVCFRDTIDNILKIFKEPEGVRDDGKIYEKILLGYSFPNLSVIVKKERLVKLGGFCEDIRVQNSEDHQMWLRLVDDKCKVYCIANCLFYYRLHENQVTAQDSFGFARSFWGLYLAKLSRTTNKNKYLHKRLIRKLVYEIHHSSRETQNALISLYLKPLKRFDLFIFNKLLLLLGINVFEKFHYKFSAL